MKEARKEGETKIKTPEINIYPSETQNSGIEKVVLGFSLHVITEKVLENHSVRDQKGLIQKLPL